MILILWSMNMDDSFVSWFFSFFFLLQYFKQDHCKIYQQLSKVFPFVNRGPSSQLISIWTRTCSHCKTTYAKESARYLLKSLNHLLKCLGEFCSQRSACKQQNNLGRPLFWSKRSACDQRSNLGRPLFWSKRSACDQRSNSGRPLFVVLVRAKFVQPAEQLW